MRRILPLLPIVLLCSGCGPSRGPTAPAPIVSDVPTTLSGIAYDATDEATGARARLSNVRVTLHAWNEDTLVEESVFAETKSDQDGRYSLRFNPKDTVWLGAWKDGYRYYAVRLAVRPNATLDIELVRR